jgi:hypothetical protein
MRIKPQAMEFERTQVGLALPSFVPLAILLGQDLIDTGNTGVFYIPLGDQFDGDRRRIRAAASPFPRATRPGSTEQSQGDVA